MHIVIIGGGITGLAAAHRLLSSSSEAKVLLLEAGPRLGGRIATFRVDGFVIEAGPDSFLTSKPRGIGLAEELGLANRLQGTRSDTRGAYVLRAGRLHPMPEGLTGLVPSRLEPLLASDLFSSVGKARLQAEPSIPPMPPDGDEALAAFVERRLGREVYERLIEPLMAGIYAGDGERLSLGATFPQLRRLELEYGSLIAGIQAMQKSASQPALRQGFATPVGGMAEIVDALVARVGSSRIVTRSPVRGMHRHAAGFRLDLDHGGHLDTDAIVLAVPAHAASSLLSGIAPRAADALAEVPYVSTATIALGYKRDDLPDMPVGHGYVIPRVEGRHALACTWVSQKFEHRAPGDAALFRVFIGRAGELDPLGLPDDILLRLGRFELHDTLGIAAEPILQHISRHPMAMPQYTVGHLERLATVDAEIAAHEGVFLGGALRGVGIPDCVVSGETAADQAAAFVQQSAQAST